MTDEELINGMERTQTQVWWDRKENKWQAFRAVEGHYPVQPMRNTLRECIEAALTLDPKPK